MDSDTSRTPSRTPSRTASRASSSKFGQNDDDEEAGMLHLTFDFLKPDKIKDKDGRRPSDPDYDPRTLHVPKEFMNKQSPGHQQW